MQYSDGKPDELKEKFWHALEASSFVMLQRDADPESAAPMTASLDKNANHAIWFFTSRDNRFAAKGPATATFASKGHDLFARFSGLLVEETDKARLDKQWSNFVEAWFPGGKQDPNVLFLRMDLGQAAIWSADQGLLTTAKMALGMDVRDDVKGSYAETTL
jgi:general stress protein 26